MKKILAIVKASTILCIMKLTDEIRQAIRDCGKTRYRISQETGILESTLSRLMAGHGVSSDTLDTLSEYLELTLASRPSANASRKGS